MRAVKILFVRLWLKYAIRNLNKNKKVWWILFWTFILIATRWRYFLWSIFYLAHPFDPKSLRLEVTSNKKWWYLLASVDISKERHRCFIIYKLFKSFNGERHTIDSYNISVTKLYARILTRNLQHSLWKKNLVQARLYFI